MNWFTCCRWRLLCVWLVMWSAGASAQLVEIRAAQVSIMVPGQVTTRSVSLPFLWDAQQRGQSGLAVFDMAFTLDTVPSEMYSLLIPKIANGYEVYLNGVRLDRFGDLSRHQVTDSKLPRRISVPPNLLKGENQLRIAIRADAGRQGGLSAVTLGPNEAVEDRFQSYWRARVLGRAIVATVSLLVGAVGLILWLTQQVTRPDGTVARDPVYLYGGLAELFWVFRLVDSLTESPPLPLAWLSVASSVAVGGWGCLMALFCMTAIGWKTPRDFSLLRSFLGALALAGVPAAIAGWVYMLPMVLTVWYGALALTFLLVTLDIARHALARSAPQYSRLLAAAIVFNVAMGSLDLYRLRIEPSTVGSTGLYFSSLLFGLVAGVIVLQRFRAASQQVVELNASLARRVAQKEIELAASYQRLAQGVQEQARSGERSRILRDMHDGVGSQISTAIRQLQSGRASGDEVLQTLRDSLDQLKLSIDAIHLPPGDVTALLANLRYRLEPRLRACGIELEWAVEALAPVAAMDAGAMRQLQFMLFEAISNVMQHARASQLRIEAQQLGPGVQVGVVDNGCGFDTSQVPRRGLRLMQERAQTIGAQLHIDSQPGHTALVLRIG